MSYSTPISLYDLRSYPDHPLFEGFADGEKESLTGTRSVFENLYHSPTYDEERRLAPTWKPPRVIGDVPPYNDFPEIMGIYPAFSQRAVDALRTYLEPNGELLPLDSEVGKYYFFNATTISDALDEERSECRFFDAPPRRAVDISSFAFHEEQLRGLAIFRIRQWRQGLIVSEEFVETSRRHELEGLCFLKIWPLEPGVHWRIDGEKAINQEIRQKLKPLTVVVVLHLDGAEPTSEERAIVDAFETDLIRMLKVRSKDVPYLGHYEGYDYVDGTCRLFFSCPSLEPLIEKLKRWIDGLAWPGKVELAKRYGYFQDANADGEFVL